MEDYFRFIRRGFNAWLHSVAADPDASDRFLDGEYDLAISGAVFDDWVLPNVAGITLDDIVNDPHPFLDVTHPGVDRVSYWRGVSAGVTAVLSVFEGDPELAAMLRAGDRSVIVNRDGIALAAIPADVSGIRGV